MVWTTIRASLQTVMSSQSSSTKLSSSSHLTKNESGGWKWEVNHDGVIWSWYHPYPSVTPISQTPSNPSVTPSLSQPTEQTVSKDPTSKYTLVDYWYTVHDGPIIPTINDY